MDNIFSKSFKNLFLLFAVFMLVFGVVSAADVIINIENQYDVYPISGSLPDDYILNTKPSVIEDVTPIEVSLSGTYAGNVRIEATNPFETDIQLWAEDTEGNWYDISKTGWGPSLGFPITSDVTEVYPAGIEGTYTVTIDVKAINGTEAGNTIATKSEDISFGIQSAVDNAGAEDIIYISAGTYEEDLLIDATKTGLTLIGESKEDVILDVSDVDGVSGCSPLSGICILADDITLKDFTIAGDNETIVERAIKLREVDNVELTNLLIKNIKKDKGSWFTGVGIDAFISSNINFNNLEIIDNGGAGIYMKNPQGASISDITTNNNSWGGIAIGNDCAYSTCSTTGVVISGTNSFGESLDESPNGGIYLEAENGGVMPNFGYSSSEVQIQQNDFEYILSGEPSGDLPQVLFFKSKEKAIDSALSNLHVHLAEDGRYVKEIGGKNYYVEEGMSIQDAIDDATAGDVINVGAGEYDETLNIEDKNDIKIIGENKDTTILKPTTKLDWNIGSYTNNRQTLIRVIDSTNIDFQLLTLDMENIKSNFLFGVLYWDSTGELSNNAFKNNQLSDLSGGYYELGLGLRAPGYSDESRAYINVSNNIFGNTGRVAINTHDYVAMDIIGNTFYKTENDFGYAIELGSRSIGNIKDNLIYGYNTKAESDNSESAGIYIENAFTNDQITSLEKNIVIENNEIYNSQFGIWIGNGYDKFAGNVNIIGTVKNNYVHDSFCSNCGSEDIFGGILIQDEDKEYGSSVNLTFSNNTIQNNEYGYYIFTQGDGNLDLDFEEETIENNKFGFYVTETEDGSSLYNINIKHSSIINNEHYALYNDLTEIINAIDNWWGSNDPYFENLISGDVTYSPWITKAESIVETESGVEKEVNTTGTNSSINLTTSTSTSGTITVQQYGNDPKGGFSLNSNALGKFINIESTISNEDISEVEIRIYYTDSEILASGLDETTLKMHYYNETTSAWEIVNSSGVNVTGNYVWAITDHFSDYGVGGENDTSGPFINLSHLSKPYPNPNDEDFTIYVWANITDPSGVKDYPTLQWKAKTREGTIVYDNGETSMQPFGDLYYGGITAPKIDGLEILYKITAYDNLDIDSYYPNCQITGTLFYYDGLAPVTSLIIGFEDTPIYETDLIYVNSSTKFNLTCDDGANGNGCNKTSYKINGSSWINFISEFLIDNSNNDGVYNISYYSIDNSNNDEDVKSQLVTLDNTAPVTTDDSSSNWTNQDVIVKLNPTDSGSGVGTTYYCVGDENCEPNLNNTLNILVDCLDDDVCQKYVRYYSVDNLGNAESVKTSQQINIDKIAPVTEDSRTDDLWYNENVTVTLTPSLETGESGINATYYCIDSDGTCNPRTDGEQGTIINIGTEGINYLRYQSEDLAGNLEAVQSTDYPVQIDKETPTLYYHSRTNPTDTDMKADDTDLPETLGYGYYDHIGDGFNWTGDKLLQNISIRFYDGNPDTAGTLIQGANVSGCNLDPLWIDPTNGATIGGTFYPQYLEFGLWGSDFVGDLGDYEDACDPLFNNIHYAEVVYYEIEAYDLAWNKGRLVGVLNFNQGWPRDTEAPTTSDDYEEKNNTWQNTTQIIELTENCGSSGCVWTKYCTYLEEESVCNLEIDGTDYIEPVLIDSQGTTYFKYASKDNAYNLQNTTELIIKIDLTPPTISDNYTENDGEWVSTNQTIELTPSDGTGSGIAEVLYCAEEDCTPNKTLEKTEDKYILTYEGTTNKTVRYLAIDNAGNPSNVESFKVMIDQVLPVINHDFYDKYLIDEGDWINVYPTITLTATDTGSGIEKIAYCYGASCDPAVDGTQVDSNTTQIIFDEDQDTIVRYQAWDNQGTASDIGNFSVRIDMTLPTIKAISPGGGLTTSNVLLSVKTSEETLCRYGTTLEENFNDMTYALGNETYEKINHTKNVTLEDGSYYYRVKCKDKANNEVTDVISFSIDTTGNFGFTKDLSPVWDSFELNQQFVLDDLGYNTTALRSPSNILSSLDENYEIVWYYNGANWLSYDPSAEPYENSLIEFNDQTNSPYWIKMLNKDRLELVNLKA